MLHLSNNPPLRNQNTFVSRKSVYKKQIWHLQSKVDRILMQAVTLPAKQTNEPIMDLTGAHALEPKSLESKLSGVDSILLGVKHDHPEATIHDKLIQHPGSQNVDETISTLTSGSQVLGGDFSSRSNLRAMMPEPNPPPTTGNITSSFVVTRLVTRDSTSAHVTTASGPVVTKSPTSGISTSEPFWQARSTRTWLASSSMAPFFKPNALKDWLTDMGRR